VSNTDLTELETRAAQLGYRYDGLVRVEHPFADQENQVTWTIVLIDTAGEELTFQAPTIEGAIEVANDRMALLSGLCDL
jgi:hypothetical protein